ncbi:ubiquinol-cytochrome c reductase iron-sulfur subunit [Luteimicrobium subarcticum]|uniref:Cytochrome bc1 complex Rieske iron-sulfur subunit n=1 Tax=Luteimicrobium subarcticum TaxID=620910 RepID=A0A2M8WRC5_9MICO|nr:Rieske 2Fe-2S domain-containing protein [Luteimicrobium subarcticum]PJI93485.1 menaquinol-cytochrome c reductase iron-sulfur subunit precursor [Luteimicrobium subarcticum]
MSESKTDVTVHPDAEHPEKFSDPGLPSHRPRQADIDPKADKRAERQVVVLFLLSVIGTIVALWAYFAVRPDGTTGGVRTSTLTLGIAIFFALAGIGIGAIHWAKTLMNDHEMVEERHQARTTGETREIAVKKLQDGIKDSGIGRRGVLKGVVVSALALFPLTIAVPLISSVGGDWDVSKFRDTLWKKGTRLTYDPTGRPIKASDVTLGSAVHVIPEVTEEYRTTDEWITEKAKAVVLMVRLDPRDLNPPAKQAGWDYDGIVAFSKICTHVGCPVALYEQQTHHLLCPCHQSTFDVAHGAKVVFGPAKRPLPQLPITVDADGYLVARDGFDEPVGPSYWERLK